MCLIMRSKYYQSLRLLNSNQTVLFLAIRHINSKLTKINYLPGLFRHSSNFTVNMNMSKNYTTNLILWLNVGLLHRSVIILKPKNLVMTKSLKNLITKPYLIMKSSELKINYSLTLTMLIINLISRNALNPLKKWFVNLDTKPLMWNMLILSQQALSNRTVIMSYIKSNLQWLWTNISHCRSINSSASTSLILMYTPLIKH